MKKLKPILLLWAVLFASLGGCFGPLMAGTHSMDCCASMPCHSASQTRACCAPGLPGLANQLQQSTEVTAPTVVYAVLATLPLSSDAPGAVRAAHIPFSIHCNSPPGELYTIHHSFLI
jgi:hypothetical protein